MQIKISQEMFYLTTVHPMHFPWTIENLWSSKNSRVWLWF